ncbi:MAG: J domain-containing protein [Alphaproteobacteria bacterium]|nr:J domain-containing protein [Alphaproteobacteria bacterium]
MRKPQGIELEAFWDDQPQSRPCEHPGCRLPGEHRAPRSRSNVNEYYHFCLEHVRAYNATWDFCAGLSTPEIERQIRADSTWQRPTWPLGRWGANRFYEAARRGTPKGFGFFDDDDESPAPGRRKGRGERDAGQAGGKGAAPAGASVEENRACHVLELPPGTSFAVVKGRYKQLVKKLHPDANGGDREAEERLKTINQAYSVLKSAHLSRNRAGL